ncbi:hypothetical protein IT407_00560 [Candidatus Uhrbacteria bacterium]|nr:hypothetical protein [Candidatus Uhrbacteria bacterium]
MSRKKSNRMLWYERLLLNAVLFLWMMTWPVRVMLIRLNRLFGLEFVRRTEDRLQTPIDYYQRESDGRKIVVVGTMHVGLASYYETLTKIINELEADHIILYELVKAPSKEEMKSVSHDEQRSNKKVRKAMASFRRFICRLGLEDQKESLEYKASWINTDISWKELSDLTEKSSDLILALAKFEASIKTRAERKIGLALIALIIGQMPLFDTLSPLLRLVSKKAAKQHAVIVEHRNDVAMEAMLRHAETSHVATIWGAGHLPGLGTRLRKAGFRNISRQWHTAFIVPKVEIL